MAVCLQTFYHILSHPAADFTEYIYDVALIAEQIRVQSLMTCCLDWCPEIYSQSKEDSVMNSRHEYIPTARACELAAH